MDHKPGQVVIISLILILALSVLIGAMLGRTANFLRFGANNTRQEQAVNVAEAGLDKALWQLNETAGSYTGETNTNLGTPTPIGQFTVTVTGTTNLKTITSTGYVPDATSPRTKRTIKVDALVSSEQIAFNYAVQIGTGGVDLENSATITGNVYSNGTITGSGTARIKGDAYAVGPNSISDPPCTPSPPANPPPGCIEHEGQPPSVMPTIDYQYWKDQAALGGTIDCSVTPTLCTLDGQTTNIGPKKYIGTLTIANASNITMDGPIWVAKDTFGIGGDFDIKNNLTTLKLNESFGSTGTVLITDGKIVVQNGAAILPTTANPKGYILAVTTSTDPLEAINVKNAGNNALFYALDGGALVQNDDARVTSLVAKFLKMKNASQLTYDLGLASAQFSSGPGGSWQIKKGTYRFTGNP